MVAVPLFMRDVSLTLGTVPAEYNCHVALALLEVSPGDEVTLQTLCTDGTFSEVGPPTYALSLRLAQDWSADGLARYLWDNEGTTQPFVLQAHGESVAAGADTPTMTGTVRLVPGSYGGEVGTYAEAEVKLPCIGKPVLDATAA